jgi:hypothetical protein
VIEPIVTKLAEAMARADAPAGEGIYAKCPSIYTSKAALALACINADPGTYGLRHDYGSLRREENYLATSSQPNV